MPSYSKRVAFFVLLFGLCTSSVAQTSPQPQSEPSSSKPDNSISTAQSKSKEERQIEKKEQSQRILGVIPDFGTTNRQHASALTSQQKLHLAIKSAFDPAEIAAVAAQSGLSQAENEFPEYGQGAAGYGKRFGATLADEVSSSFWVNYFYPVVTKEDPRYFRLGQGSIMRRIRYALLQEVVCHTDKGGRSFSWENFLGAFTTGGLSNVYYPPAERGLGLTMSRSAISIGYGSLGGLVDEFYPDIARRLFHRHEKVPGQTP